MEKNNNIQNNNIIIEDNQQKENLKNEIVINIANPNINQPNEKGEENEIIEINKNNIESDKEEKKYKIKFSVLIETLRNFSDKAQKINSNEFITNLLLMSSQINKTNQISCLTLLSYTYYKRKNALSTYYINKKIFNYLKIQKSIEPFTYIRTLYRAAFFLEEETNLFYAKKYVNEAESLGKNSKMDLASYKMLKDIKESIEKEIGIYLEFFLEKFRDVESPQNLDEEKYIKMKYLFKDLNDNNYKNNNEDDSYLYILNKNWFIKANQFFSDYIKVRDNSIKDNYFKVVFEPNYCYQNYFDIFDELQKNNYKYSPFPCLIDNYSIINWTDNWFDPLNEDENFILQKGLKEGKDYFLLQKNDFELLQKFFGVTNTIKRKRKNLVEIKALILDKRLKKEENNCFLKKRYLQVKEDYKIIDLKEKIMRCINFNLEKNHKETLELLKKEKEKEEKKEKEKKDNINIIQKEKEKENKNDENKKIEIIINKKKKEEEEKEDEGNNNYNINFYLLEKEKKDILMEICISLTNDIPKYETINLQKIPISEEDSLSNLLAIYNKKKHILIIELYQKDSSFINLLLGNNNIFNCSICQKEINILESTYKCNICNYSLFCSKECSNKDLTHEKLDKVYIDQYLYEEFNLESFLKKDMSALTMLSLESNKGMAGLSNLGNTCYMNSTLQCLSNTFDLTKYFLLQYFRNDINTGNKLGSNGNIASKYYDLLCELWSGTNKKINPEIFVKTFKTLKKQFDGYRQQDAQEFLSVLLEQLHEDLNRITEKPYIELLEKQQNENDLIASKRWWDLHKKREDSIIIDLFNGQFKSETICQVCKKSSITYDPFASLCVPLPKAKIHLHFKIFLDMEYKCLDILYSEKQTLEDLKKAAIDFILPFRKGAQFFDLEMVLLDEYKTVQKIISTDIKDKKNYMGKKEIINFLLNNQEIIFFEKKTNLDEKNYTIFFIYPIEHQKPDKTSVYYKHSTPLKYLSYPLYFQAKNDSTIIQFYNAILKRINNVGFFIEEKYSSFYKDNTHLKILDLNIIHGKDTKKEGFLAMFYIEDVCKFCGNSNETNYYCSIKNLGPYEKTIKEIFNKIKKPVILAAASECYNLSGKLYLECPLFESNYQIEKESNKYLENIALKECLELLVKNENFQDDESWYCKKCQKLQKSKQKLQIYKPPNYLIILLKRYNFKKSEGNNFSGEKNNTFISYPIDNFDIREYIEGPEKNKAIYELYGVIEHYGTLNQGHYKAICKNDGNWISYNDSLIDIVKSPVTKNAYVLFYKMKDIENKKNDKNAGII